MTQDVLAPPITSATAASVEEVGARHDEPSWLRERRLEAWRQFESMDLPDPGNEEWRRTDVRSLPLERLALHGAPHPAASVDSLPRDLRAALGDEPRAGCLVQAGSGVAFAQLADDAKAQGVVLTDLHTAAREHADLLRARLYSAVRPDEWKYLALNAALWSGGAFLYVPNDVELALPVHLLQSLDAAGTAVLPRTVIVAGRNSRLSVIDETHAPDGVRALVSGAVELFLEDGASVEYYEINRWGDEIYNFKTVRAVLGRDAGFVATAAGVGSRLTKMRIDVEMPQSGAHTELLGVTFGNDAQHFDYNTLQDHVGGHTVSDLQFKSALKDSASLVWYGVTRINPTAGGSEANQTSRNLLLSEHAKAAPIPILEIQAYDVSKCSHGATVGPVDEDELFYLQARGVPRDVAEQMLVEGFFADVVDRIPGERLRARIMDAVLAKAGGVPDSLTFDDVLSA